MKRRTVHLFFGAVALVCLSMSAFHGYRLKQAADDKRRIEQLRTAGSIETLENIPAASNKLLLEKANALARLGDPDGATRTFNRLIQQDPAGPAGVAARFNLANLYLRQSIDNGLAAGASPAPDLELAKQRYREVLKLKPEHWDARYNLEQALRLAPEHDGATPGEKDIKERRRVRLPDMSPVQLP